MDSFLASALEELRCNHALEFEASEPHLPEAMSDAFIKKCLLPEHLESTDVQCLSHEQANGQNKQDLLGEHHGSVTGQNLTQRFVHDRNLQSFSTEDFENIPKQSLVPEPVNDANAPSSNLRPFPCISPQYLSHSSVVDPSAQEQSQNLSFGASTSYATQHSFELSNKQLMPQQIIKDTSPQVTIHSGPMCANVQTTPGQVFVQTDDPAALWQTSSSCDPGFVFQSNKNDDSARSLHHGNFMLFNASWSSRKNPAITDGSPRTQPGVGVADPVFRPEELSEYTRSQPVSHPTIDDKNAHERPQPRCDNFECDSEMPENAETERQASHLKQQTANADVQNSTVLSSDDGSNADDGKCRTSVKRKNLREMRRATSKKYRENLSSLFDEAAEVLKLVFPDRKARTKNKLIRFLVEGLQLVKCDINILEGNYIMSNPANRFQWSAEVVRNASTFPSTILPLMRLMVLRGWSHAELWCSEAFIEAPHRANTSAALLDSARFRLQDTVNTHSEHFSEVPAKLLDFIEMSSRTSCSVGDDSFIGLVQQSLSAQWFEFKPSKEVSASDRSTLAIEAGFKNCCALPLLLWGRVAAVIIVYSYRDNAAFRPEIEVALDMAYDLCNRFGAERNPSVVHLAVDRHVAENNVH